MRLFNPLDNSSPLQALEGVVGAILQAPVSDREYIVEELGLEKYETSIRVAKDVSESDLFKIRHSVVVSELLKLMKGFYVLFDGCHCFQQLVQRSQANHPIPLEFSEMFSGGRGMISAERWLSLACKGSENLRGEDFFSSDLSIQELGSNLGQFPSLKIPVMVLYSDRDECVPGTVEKVKLFNRLIDALADQGQQGQQTREWSTIFEGASHSAEEVADLLVERVVGFINTLV